MRYGTGEHKVFEVDVVSEANPDYKGLRNIGQDRYIGVYIAQDWRTYTSINNNIKGSQIEFFKLDTSVPTTPTITAAGVVDFNASVGRTVEKTISVSGVNLTEGITVTGAVAPFAVSPTTIDKEGGDLTISYSPTAAGTHTVTLTLSSQGAEDKTIEVTGEAFATVGDGSETAPFTVADVIILDNALGDVDKYWVKGYIVAAQAASGGGALTPLQTNFAEEAAATAILLADNPDETELENMTPVQLPAGTDARANLNLKDNPDNFKKEVVVEGILTAYFGQTPGIRSVENYILEEPEQINWANLQWPIEETITIGDTYEVYGQAYHAGLTDVNNDGLGIDAWLGWNSENTNPAEWVNWIKADFNGKVGNPANNYEYMADLGAEIDQEGVYYYAYRYKMGGAEYVYGGTNGFWDGEENVSGVLTVNADASKDIDWGNVQWPEDGEIFVGGTFDVYGQVYKEGITTEANENDKLKAWLGYTTDNSTNPADWDEEDWIDAAFQESGKGGEGNNHEYLGTLSGLDKGTYYYVYRYRYDDGANHYAGTGGEFDGNNYGELVVKEFAAPVATGATNVSETGFTANWDVVTGADSYKLDVYSKTTGSSPSDIFFGFEGSTNLPKSWAGDGYVQNNSTNARTGTYYAGFNAKDKYIQTNSIDNILNLKFYYRYSGATSNNTVKVQSSTDNTTWIDEGTYTATGSSAPTTYAEVNLPITSGSKYIRWIMTARSGGSFYFDDVTITSGEAGTSTSITGYPTTVSGTSKEITGLTAGTDYFYIVQAVAGSHESDWSNEVKVTTTGGTVEPPIVAPTAHVTGFEAEEDGENKIMLGWTDSNDAEGYLIKASVVSCEDITDPKDGTPENDGTLVKNIAAGEEIVEFGGLTAGTKYFFKIFPYNGSGNEIAYLIDEAPCVDATTEELQPVDGLILNYNIDFDDEAKWEAGSAVISSYANDHKYEDKNWIFTGGPALRNTTTVQDGYAGAIGNYAWRLRDKTTTSWTATYKTQTDQVLLSFGFDARRWDNSPNPQYLVEYSYDGGENWNTATSIGNNGVLNNDAFDNLSDWKTFSQAIEISPTEQFVVRLSATEGERVHIDNFTYTVKSDPIFNGTGDWDNAANWMSEVMPETAENAIVEGSATISRVVNLTKLTVRPSGSLTIDSEGALLADDFTLQSDATGTATLVGNYTGNITVEQYLNMNRSWYMSSPVNGELNAENVDKFYTFDVGSDTWGSVEELPAAGIGIMVNPNATGIVSFSGTLNNDDLDLVLAEEGRRFHYLGNPYPSFLSWEDIVKGDDIEETIWFRTVQDGEYQFVTNNGEFGTMETDGTIAPMQGFWVRVAKDGTDTDIIFDNSERTHAPGAGTTQLRAPKVDLPVARLVVSDGSLHDEAIVYFKESNSNSKDRFDAAKMMNNNSIPAIWTIVDGEATVINAMQTIPYNMDMVLGFSTKKADQFTISAKEFSGFAERDHLYLIDKENGNTADLVTGDYSFSSGETNTSERFVIRFAPASITGLQDKSVDNSYVYVNGSDIVVNLSGAADARATVYSVSGQQIASQLLQTNTTTVARGVNKGVYLVVIDNGASRVSKRVIVK